MAVETALIEGLLLAFDLLGTFVFALSGVHQIPVLSVEDEQRLAHRLREDNDIAAAQELILSHLRFVVHVARGYSGYGLQLGDLIQEGNIGLMKAVKRFDPERGVRLVSFAMHWIKAEIHEYILKNWRMVKVATTKAQRKLFFNLRSHRTDAHTLSAGDVEHIAAKLNVKASEVMEMETRLTGQDMALEPMSDDSDDDYGPISYLAAHNAEPTQVLERRHTDRLQGEGIEQALASLDARSRRIIESRWLRDESEGGTLTLHDLADEFGVSAERIRQIEVKAMQKMKAALAEYA